MRLVQPLGMVPWNRKVYDGEYSHIALVALIDRWPRELPVVAVDVGAQAGAFGLWLNARVADVGLGYVCHCYEPVHGIRAENSFAGREWVEAAVSAVAGVLTLARRPGGNPGEWQLVQGPVQEGWATREVPCIAAATLPPAHILKLDCEGAEADILENYLPVAPDLRYVAFEWHSAAVLQRCNAALVGAGFSPLETRYEPNGTGVSKWAR